MITPIQQIQVLLGVPPDNNFGPRSKAALSAASRETIQKVQTILGVDPDGDFGPASQAALSKASVDANLTVPAPVQTPAGSILRIIERQPYYWDGHELNWTGYGRVDDDGTGGSFGDRDHQSDTSLHKDGRALNAEVDFYIVLPLPIFHLIPADQEILGCQAYVSLGDSTIPAVIGDAGPPSRSGEAARIVWRKLGISDNPNNGGVNTAIVRYRALPGVPAVVNGITYSLQHCQLQPQRGA